MKKRKPLSHRIGKVTITRFSDEVIIDYTGSKGIILKRFKRSKIRGLFLLLFFLGAIGTGSLFFTELSARDHKEPSILSKLFYKEEMNADDEKKNALLLSKNTDFSKPTEQKKLKINKYRIKKGDSLSEIARIHGVSMDTICGSNDLHSYDLIPSGKLLKIPNQDGLLHRMKKGSRLTDLAKKYKISIRKIIAGNKLRNPDFISPGTVVFLPDARPKNIFSGFLWPCRTRRITCGYGWRRNPFNRRRRQFHSGIDIRSRYEKVRAVKYGKITFAGWMGGYGKAVIIAHPGGYKSLYAHLSRIYVRRGQYVKQGQSIGKSGNTGRSTGPHLHLELIKRGRHKNPYFLLKRR